MPIPSSMHVPSSAEAMPAVQPAIPDPGAGVTPAVQPTIPGPAAEATPAVHSGGT